MTHLANLLKYIDLSGKGIEVAPYFNPAVPRRKGYDVHILDVFDADTLRRQAAKDRHIPPERLQDIEEVDMVGDASRLAEIAEKLGIRGKVNYIVSSHNFEHLPNPILFFQGAYDTLAPGGVLSMAMPDYRACFDHFRMPTRLSDWLAAFHDNRAQPAPETIFDSHSNFSMYMREGDEQVGCAFPTDDPENFHAHRQLMQAYDTYKLRKSNGGEYLDTHCSVVFPELFELFLNDLRMIGLVKLEVIEISQTLGLEFFVHLRKPKKAKALAEEDFYARRQELLQQVARGLGAAPYAKAGEPESPSMVDESNAIRRTLKAAKRELRNARARRSKLARRIDYLDYKSCAFLSKLPFLSKRMRSRFAAAAERRWLSTYGKRSHRRP